MDPENQILEDLLNEYGDLTRNLPKTPPFQLRDVIRGKLAPLPAGTGGFSSTAGQAPYYEILAAAEEKGLRVSLRARDGRVFAAAASDDPEFQNRPVWISVSAGGEDDLTAKVVLELSSEGSWDGETDLGSLEEVRDRFPGELHVSVFPPPRPD